MTIPGIHHITAIAGDPQRNLDFYAGTLGLRLVKLTVNFDDNGSYHFYFGDPAGRPGSILTFFPWPAAYAGRPGTGQATRISFAVPSLAGWAERLPGALAGRRFGCNTLEFADPDGIRLELVETGTGDSTAITAFHGVTLSHAESSATARFLVDTFGYREAGQEDHRQRFVARAGNFVELLTEPGTPRGSVGVGTVHHVAFRAESDEIHLGWRDRLNGLGLRVTPILDRNYFRSLYFREPGGVLFEIATDAPGFTADETPENLGTSLKLPAWLEPARPGIEQKLPKLVLPQYAR